MTITTMFGHRRDEDAIQDDKNRLISAKQDWLVATDAIARHCNTVGMADSYVGAEEQVNDMIQSEWDALCEEDGCYDNLPQSVHMKKWLHESRKPNQFRAQVSLLNGTDEPYVITDSATRERTVCDSEAHLWQVFDQIQARGNV